MTAIFLSFMIPKATVFLQEKFPNFSTYALKIRITANILNGTSDTFHLTPCLYQKNLKKGITVMNEYDLAVLLVAYAEKCAKSCNRKHLQQTVRELKKKLNDNEIRKLYLSDESIFRLSKKI